MSYVMTVDEGSVLEPKQFVNSKGNTECVEFVRQVTSAPQTSVWVRGRLVKSFAAGELKRGTAIATFDADGKYPTDDAGRHAAIYLSHTNNGVQVLDQWRAQGKVLPRLIKFNQPTSTKRSNNGDTFHVIE